MGKVNTSSICFLFLGKFPSKLISSKYYRMVGLVKSCLKRKERVKNYNWRCFFVFCNTNITFLGKLLKKCQWTFQNWKWLIFWSCHGHKTGRRLAENMSYMKSMTMKHFQVLRRLLSFVFTSTLHIFIKQSVPLHTGLQPFATKLLQYGKCRWHALFFRTLFIFDLCTLLHPTLCAFQ